MEAPFSGVTGESDASEALLWQRWRDAKDSAARRALIDLHLSHAKVIAAICYGRRFNDEIEFGDYHQWATVALLECMDRFDPLHGVKFRTFASHRMHGAVLDGLQQMTEKQQQISTRKRLLAQRRSELLEFAEEGMAREARGSRSSRDDKVLTLVAEAGIAHALAWLLDGTGMLRADEESSAVHFYRSTEVAQLKDQVDQVVQALPDRERSVIKGHYFQQQPFEEIARDLELSRGRISQIHRRALEQLKDLMFRRRVFDGSS